MHTVHRYVEVHMDLGTADLTDIYQRKGEGEKEENDVSIVGTRRRDNSSVVLKM